MSELDNIMRKYMKYLVYEEKRPFSFHDFLSFSVDGKKYSISKGTFRTKMCYTFKDEVQLICYSPSAFYTLKNCNTTDDHTGGTALILNSRDKLSTDKEVNDIFSPSLLSEADRTYLLNLPISRYIKKLPLGKRSIHDIRLRFVVTGLWHLLFNSSKFTIFTRSKDILLCKFKRDNMDIRVTIHTTDTISISIGCSFVPVTLDIQGLSRLNNTLTTIENRILRAIEEARQNFTNFHVPHFGSWIVTMWHFGRDASVTYEKKEFCIEYKTAQEVIIRIYDKYWKDEERRRIRIERQEYPNKSYENAIEEKLHEDG